MAIYPKAISAGQVSPDTYAAIFPEMAQYELSCMIPSSALVQDLTKEQRYLELAREEKLIYYLRRTQEISREQQDLRIQLNRELRHAIAEAEKNVAEATAKMAQAQQSPSLQPQLVAPVATPVSTLGMSSEIQALQQKLAALNVQVNNINQSMQQIHAQAINQIIAQIQKKNIAVYDLSGNIIPQAAVINLLKSTPQPHTGTAMVVNPQLAQQVTQNPAAAHQVASTLSVLTEFEVLKSVMQYSKVPQASKTEVERAAEAQQKLKPIPQASKTEVEKVAAAQAVASNKSSSTPQLKFTERRSVKEDFEEIRTSYHNLMKKEQEINEFNPFELLKLFKSNRLFTNVIADTYQDKGENSLHAQTVEMVIRSAEIGNQVSLTKESILKEMHNFSVKPSRF